MKSTSSSSKGLSRRSRLFTRLFIKRMTHTRPFKETFTAGANPRKMDMLVQNERKILRIGALSGVEPFKDAFKKALANLISGNSDVS